MTVYAIMQPPEPPPPASMGVEEMGSASGELEVRVKSEAKESIVMCVCGLRDALNLSEAKKLGSCSLFIPRKSELRT